MQTKHSEAKGNCANRTDIIMQTCVWRSRSVFHEPSPKGSRKSQRQECLKRETKEMKMSRKVIGR